MKIDETLENMKFSPGDNFIEAVEKMIQPALFKGYFGTSYTRIVSGLQYHLCGELDTRELAELTNIKPDDIILDECCAEDMRKRKYGNGRIVAQKNA